MNTRTKSECFVAFRFERLGSAAAKMNLAELFTCYYGFPRVFTYFVLLLCRLKKRGVRGRVLHMKTHAGCSGFEPAWPILNPRTPGLGLSVARLMMRRLLRLPLVYLNGRHFGLCVAAHRVQLASFAGSRSLKLE